jgi:hypothetical protein
MKQLRFAAAGILAWLAGCAAPPSAAEFADATVALRAAVEISGTTLERTIRESGLPSADVDADKAKAAWQRRNAVMDQAVAYADGLQAIAEASYNSTQTVQALAGKVQALAGAAGIAMPAQSVIDTATDGAGWIYKQIANAWAAKSMEQSLVATDAAIQEIAVILAADRKDMDELLDLLETTDVGGMRTAADYVDLPVALAKDEAAIRALAIENASAEELQKLQAFLARADTVRAKLGELEAKVTGVQASYRLQHTLLDAFGEAMASWSAAHSQLVRAVRDSRQLSASALIEATEELRAIVRRIDEL